MAKRSIIKIDEDLCNGCGLCVPGCAEGALQIVDGKARLVREQYCDGLGACLGQCPTGALTIEERESDAFDLASTNDWLTSIGREPVAHPTNRAPVTPVEGGSPKDQGHAANHAQHGGCPGSRLMTFDKSKAAAEETTTKASSKSELNQWPIQLMLVPPTAPYLKEADLLVAADCVPFAYPDFHRKMLKNKVLVIACPKLDDADHYVEKLAQMIRINDFRSITIAHMEVPCCFGLGRIINEAIKRAGVKVPVMSINVGVQGDLK